MRLFYFIGIVSGILWGTNDVLTNLLSNQVVPIDLGSMLLFAVLLACIQDIVSAVSIIGFYRLRSVWVEQWRGMLTARSSIFLAALCAGPLGLVCSILAIVNAGAVYAGAITAAYPLVTLIGSSLYLRESISGARIVGVLVGVCSVVAIGLIGLTTPGPHMVVGLLFAFVSMLGWGMESVFFSAAYTKTKINSSAILALRQLFSSSFYVFILFVILFFMPHGLSLPIKMIHEPVLLMLCILSAGVSYIAYYYCIKVLTANIATLFNVTFIFWSALISVILGLATLSLWFWAWASLLFVGIVIALWH